MNEQESVWLERARQGDKQAFGQLVQAYQRPLFNLTYRMLGNPDEAEDAAQEAFLRAFANLGKYNTDHKFSTWLFSIANHHCIDRLRKRRITWMSIDDNPVLQNLEGDAPKPETSALRREESGEIQQLLNQLEPEYRMPLILRYWEEYSYEEIGQAMDLSLAAVKSRLFRARKQMAEMYEERYPAIEPPGSGKKTIGTHVDSRASAPSDRPPRMRFALAGS